MTRPVIRPPQASDAEAWRTLWAGYNRFYEAEVPEAATAVTWSRLLEAEGALVGRIALIDGRPVGFSHSVLHLGTWDPAPVCYLEDLFVDPDLRGGGVGRALIEDLVTLGRERGWSTLYWHTREGKAAAHRLYDRFTAADDFVRYRLRLRSASS